MNNYPKRASTKKCFGWLTKYCYKIKKRRDIQRRQERRYERKIWEEDAITFTCDSMVWMSSTLPLFIGSKSLKNLHGVKENYDGVYDTRNSLPVIHCGVTIYKVNDI